MTTPQRFLLAAAFLVSTGAWPSPALPAEASKSLDVQVPHLPDEQLAAAYRHAATDNVLAAVDPKIFPGYFSVCADSQGFGYGFTYPSLDQHQMTDALNLECVRLVAAFF